MKALIEKLNIISDSRTAQTVKVFGVPLWYKSRIDFSTEEKIGFKLETNEKE